MTTPNPFSQELAALPDPLPIEAWSRPPGRTPLDCTIRPPGSKSLTNRALLLAAMAPGTSQIHHPLLDADDAQRMIAAIETLGAAVTRTGHTLSITGTGGHWPTDPTGCTIDLHHSGTATRFIAAASALAAGPITITGSPRIQQRPIDELINFLAHLNCTATYHAAQGCPPVTITPPPTNSLPLNPTIQIGKTKSSQYISALMLIATCLPQGLTLQLTGEITSPSYIRMTIDQLDAIGVRVQAANNLSVIRVHPGLAPFSIDIEPDASTASYWWAAGALLPQGTVRVQGIGVPETAPSDTPLRDSLQGDARFPLLLEQMGCTLISKGDTLACRGSTTLRGILADMASMPDAVMTLAAVASFAKGTTIIRGVRTLRDKECDRIQALVTELAKIGVRVEDNLGNDPDALSITPPSAGIDTTPDAPPICFETYDDHRMAMALSLVALKRPNCSIKDPACVAKSDAGYWRTFAALYN